MKCPEFYELPPTASQNSLWPWGPDFPPKAEMTRPMTLWPRVSIITPSFNQASYIEETIRSVLLQGYPDLEYIVIDGGSKDGTVDIIRKYQQWISHWVSESDKGQTDAINKGFRASSGEIIAWQNSDDTYEPNAIFNAVNFLIEHPETDVVYSDCHLIDKNSLVIGHLPSKEYSLSNCLLGHIVPNQTAFIRRRAWEAVGGVDQNLHFAIEEDFWLKLGIKAKLTQLPGTWANHRKYVGTKTVSQASQFYNEHLKVLDRFFSIPTLESTVVDLKKQAYINAHLFGAFRMVMDKDFLSVNLPLSKAISLSPELAQDKGAETVRRLIGWAWTPEVIDKVDFVTRFFATLPANASLLLRFRRAAIGEIAIGQFFKAVRDGNKDFAKTNLLIAVLNDPRWLLNKGVLKIGFKTLLI